MGTETPYALFKKISFENLKSCKLFAHSKLILKIKNEIKMLTKDNIFQK